MRVRFARKIQRRNHFVLKKNKWFMGLQLFVVEGEIALTKKNLEYDENNQIFSKAILDRIVKLAAKTAVQESRQINVAEITRIAIAEYERAESKKRKDAEKQYICYTRKALEGFRALKASIADEKSMTIEEVNYKRFEFLKDLMDPGEIKTTKKFEGEAKIRLENRFYVKKMERALSYVKKEIEASGSEEMARKYRVVIALYIDKKRLTPKEIAEKENINERTVYKDVTAICKILSIYLYGFQAIAL